MNTRHTFFLMVLVPQLVLGDIADVRLGEEHVLAFNRITESGLQDVALWRQTVVSTQLVGRFIVEGDTVVSVLPTPISSDTDRPTAHFIEFGTGWEVINKLLLDDHGRLWGEASGTNRSEITLSELSGDTFHTSISEHPLVLIGVQQGAPFSRVCEILGAILHGRNLTVGLGWKPAGE